MNIVFFHYVLIENHRSARCHAITTDQERDDELLQRPPHHAKVFVLISIILNLKNIEILNTFFLNESRIPAPGRKKKRNTSPQTMDIVLKKDFEILKSKMDALEKNLLRNSRMLELGLNRIHHTIHAHIAMDNPPVKNKNNCVIM